MPSRGARYVNVANFSRGLVLNKPPTQLAPGEAAWAENVELYNNILKRRDGWQPVHTADLPTGKFQQVTSLYAHYPSGDTARLMAIAGNTLMYSQGSDFTTVSAVAASGGYAPVYATYKAVQSNLYIALRYGQTGIPVALQKYTNSGGLASISGAPSGGLVTLFGGALFVAGAAAPNDSRLYFSSHVPNQETWPANNFIDVQPGDGDKITGFGQLLNTLIVFKERSIHRVTGTTPDDANLSSGTITVNSYQDQSGCVAPNSIAVGYGRIIYVNRKGVFQYDGVKTTELTEPVRPIFENINENIISQATGGWIEPYHYVVSIPQVDSASNDLTISIRLFPSFSLTIWTGLEVSAWETFRFSGVTIPVLGLAGYVGRMDADTDNGKQVKWKYRTGILPMGPAPFTKHIRRGWLYAKPIDGNVDLEMVPNFGDEGVRVNVELGSVLTRGEAAVRHPLPSFGNAHQWALQLSGRSTGAAPEIYDLQLEVYDKVMR